MPIITIQTVEGFVLTSEEQKRDLMKKMTDTFVSVVGEVARPYTYCIIQETPNMALAGVKLPDLPFLSGPDYHGLHAKSNEIMHAYLASMQTAQADADKAKAAQAETAWGGAAT